MDPSSSVPPPAQLEMHLMLTPPPTASLIKPAHAGYQQEAAAAAAAADVTKAVVRVALAASSGAASGAHLARWSSLFEGAVFEVLDGMGGRGGRGGRGRGYEAPAPSFLSSADRARLLYVFNDTAQPLAHPASMDHHLDLARGVIDSKHTHSTNVESSDPRPASSRPTLTLLLLILRASVCAFTLKIPGEIMCSM